MFTPASKKRRFDGELKTTPSPPVIFEQPGFKVDVRLNTFGQEFHVHSIILKLYSAYFRTFLDSADKKPAQNAALFMYEYVSVVDADGEWGLEAVNMNSSTVTNDTSHGLKIGRSEKTEIAALHMLLCALYNKSYYIENYKEFEDGYRLADFYCALPKFSASLDGAIRHCDSYLFVRNIETHSTALIVAAKKLRHPTLFRECLVYEVCRLDSHEESFDILTRFDDKDLQLAILAARNNLQGLRSQADLFIHDLSPAVKSLVFNSPVKLEMHRIYHRTRRITLTNCAWFYRRVFTRLIDGSHLHANGAEIFWSLLACNLSYNVGKVVGETVGPEGYDKDEDDEGFYCAEIADEHLPWNREEIDW
ncbi:hypothetical protein CJF31_00001491 [Rutstroemia sp. NJR-2017a BVV2]|nr:hypothetical protein CJF31_00001491 [Rutstroemia sp. NJR-2017a BVV2]